MLWSCGHRLLLSLQATLAGLPEWPPELPLDLHKPASLRRLCEELSEKHRRAPDPGVPPREPPAKKPKPSQNGDPAVPPVKQPPKKPSLSRAPESGVPPAEPPAKKHKPSQNGDPAVPPPCKKQKQSAKSEVKREPPVSAEQQLVEVMSEDEEQLVEVKSEDDEGDCDKGPKANNTGRRTRPAARKKDPAADGLAMAQKLGIDCGTVFQKAHQAVKAPNGKGHWREFLCKLARNNVMACIACQQLRKSKQEEQAAELAQGQNGQEIVAAEPPPQPVDQVRAKRGRPPRGSMVPQLLPWMIEHRRGTYVHVDGCRYRCLPCGKEVYFVRETLSSVYRVYEHEGSERHKKALVRWNASQSAGSQDTTAGAALVPLAPCCGHLLGQPGGAFESLQVGGGIPVVVPIEIRYPSHLFTSVACQESMHYWIDQGCPMFKSEHCPSCAALPGNREAKEAIGQWCRRLDMASLLYRCACRSSDVPGFWRRCTAAITWLTSSLVASMWIDALSSSTLWAWRASSITADERGYACRPTT